MHLKRVFTFGTLTAGLLSAALATPAAHAQVNFGISIGASTAGPL